MVEAGVIGMLAETLKDAALFEAEIGEAALQVPPS